MATTLCLLRQRVPHQHGEAILQAHVPVDAVSVLSMQQVIMSSSARALRGPHSDAPHTVLMRARTAHMLQSSKQPRRRPYARRRLTAAVLSNESADVDEQASVASLQSQDEAYLLSPLHAVSGVDSMSLQSVDDVTMDATEWQKGLLGRMGRFAGERRSCLARRIRSISKHICSLIKCLQCESRFMPLVCAGRDVLYLMCDRLMQDPQCAFRSRIRSCHWWTALQLLRCGPPLGRDTRSSIRGGHLHVSCHEWQELTVLLTFSANLCHCSFQRVWSLQL